MDFRTISATLALLGTGLAMSGCNKTQTDATEVPAAAAGDKSEQSCKGEGHCDTHNKKGEGGCGGAKTEAPAAAAAEPAPAAVAAEPTPAATASAPAAADTKKKKPSGDKKKKKAGDGEMACGEGTCG